MMLIRKRRIHKVEGYIGHIRDGAEFKVASSISDGMEKLLIRVGFNLPIGNGNTILPSSVGPVSNFNANGKWIVFRDQGKESRYIRTIIWRWKQFAGPGQTEEHEEYKDIYRDCYPRKFISPPAIELTYLDENGIRRIVSPPLLKLQNNYENIRHCINLHLELFGECELLYGDMSSISQPPYKRVNWYMLPPGRHPFDRIETHLKGAIQKYGESQQTMILGRQKTIVSFAPDEIFTGLGGFSDYIAYKFSKLDIVVLESIRKDNAIYVFGKNWQEFSKLSKAEILSEHFHIQRIIHSKGWEGRLFNLLSKRAA